MKNLILLSLELIQRVLDKGSEMLVTFLVDYLVRHKRYVYMYNIYFNLEELSLISL